jgi:2-oxoglutarate ferredoxin oxidoreductase subunit alpha
MAREVFTYLVGGKAGEGVKKAGSVGAHIFSSLGRRVFQMDDYQSLIRGGHNFSVISTSVSEVTSHYKKADLVISLDNRSFELHKNEITKDGIHIFNSDVISTDDLPGMGFGVPMKTEAKDYPNPSLMLGVAAVASLAAVVGLNNTDLDKVIQDEYPRGVDDNKKYARTIFELIDPKLHGKFSLASGDKKRKLLTGNEAISLGAAVGGLDVYIAYPMTPSSSILHYLAAHDKDLNIAVMHPENEIAVANIAIGAAFAGARAMVGSSGGGFALMQEALSLAGMTETPLLCILSSRPGPSTGVPTYTEQGDLRFALNQGHGDFPRLVASPGSLEEAFYLTAEMLELVWRFQMPGILLTEKHLSESTMTVDLDPVKASWAEPVMHDESKVKGQYLRYRDTIDGISPLIFPPLKGPIKWSSYEHDELGITTEDPEVVARMHDKRYRKSQSLIEHLKTRSTVNTYGEGENVIFTYGSTTMSVLEALRTGDIDATVVQPVVLEPFPIWELEKFKDRSSIVVEQSVSGQFANLLWEKMRIEPKCNINRYDGRPFHPEGLAANLREVS